MKKLKLFIASLVTVLNAGLFIAPAAVSVRAQTAGENLNCGASLSLDGTNCDDPSVGADRINTTVERAIRLFQIVVGLISVVMIIFGGLKYITSGGDPNGVKGAKNTILYAVIGLVIVAIAEAIVQFVLSRFGES